MDENEAEIPDDALLRRYLLGGATEDEEARVEQLLLREPSGLERLEIVESELLDAYARGALPEDERRRVLAGLLASAEGRARLALARGLAYVANGEPATLVSLPSRSMRPPRRPSTRWRLQVAALAASLVLALGAGLWVSQHRPAGSALAPVHVELSLATRRAQTAEESIRVTAAAGRVELGLVLDPGWAYRSYRAELRDAAGETVASADGLSPVRRPAGPEILLTVPAASLPPGRYAVHVEGRPDRGPAEDLAYKELVVTR